MPASIDARLGLTMARARGRLGFGKDEGFLERKAERQDLVLPLVNQPSDSPLQWPRQRFSLIKILPYVRKSRFVRRGKSGAHQFIGGSQPVALMALFLDLAEGQWGRDG
ncbi:MAG TPA: hypothetical protein DIT35_06615 [Rhodospirillaceae bacterium]|nr:hypothetical protein [Rhodospirillaceae bacterium]